MRKSTRRILATVTVAVLSLPAVIVEAIPNGEKWLKESIEGQFFQEQEREENVDSVTKVEGDTTDVEVESTTTCTVATTVAMTTATTATTSTTAKATTTTTTTTSTTAKATTTTTAKTTTIKKATTTVKSTTPKTVATAVPQTEPKKEADPEITTRPLDDSNDAHEPVIAGGAPSDFTPANDYVPENDWNEPEYEDEDVVIANEVPDSSWDGVVLTKRAGVVPASQTPSGYKETYYNLPMSGCLKLMGLDQSLAGVRSDGVKTYDGFVMVASPNLSAYPKGSYIETTLGTGIVVDYCPSGNLDIATTW